MKYNIVTNYGINQLIKSRSKYYKVDLGQSITLESRSGDREPNVKDEFAYTYNYYYKTGILKQGQIGDIDFYTDHRIQENIILLFIDREEFVYDFDLRKVDEKGLDGFLGYILKTSEEELEIRKTQDNGPVKTKVGDADKVLKNPGSVTYDDLRAYIQQQKVEKTKIQ